MKINPMLKAIFAAVVAVTLTMAAPTAKASNTCEVPQKGGGCAPDNITNPNPPNTGPCMTRTCNGDATSSYCGGSGGSTECANNQNGSWSCSYKYYNNITVPVPPYGSKQFCDMNNQLPPNNAGLGTGKAFDGGQCAEAASNGQKCPNK